MTSKQAKTVTLNILARAFKVSRLKLQLYLMRPSSSPPRPRTRWAGSNTVTQTHQIITATTVKSNTIWSENVSMGKTHWSSWKPPIQERRGISGILSRTVTFMTITLKCCNFSFFFLSTCLIYCISTLVSDFLHSPECLWANCRRQV